uniref:Interleukin 20 receptor, alpha n=1 Tax=Mus musculus TaxID=10090 RepID=E6Y2L0_MOUSE|nr:interleukin-20 receptor 1a [Mus musculus]
MHTPGTPAPGHPDPPPLLLLTLLLLLAASGRAVPCVFCGLPKPTNITFLSINMKNVLHWNPPESLHGVEVTYTVQYFISQGFLGSGGRLCWFHLGVLMQLLVSDR